jgi:hypothetical protein
MRLLVWGRSFQNTFLLGEKDKMKKIVAFLLVALMTSTALAQLPGGGGFPPLDPPVPPDGKIFDVELTGVGNVTVYRSEDTPGVATHNPGTYDMVIQMDYEDVISKIPPIKWHEVWNNEYKFKTKVEVLQGVTADAEGNHQFSHFEVEYVELLPIKDVMGEPEIDLSVLLEREPRKTTYRQIPFWITGNDQIWVRMRHCYFDYQWGRWVTNDFYPERYVENRWDIAEPRVVTFNIDWFALAMPWQ